MSTADVVLVVANVVYGTAYVAVVLAVEPVGPVTLAFLRLAIASAILVPLTLAQGQRAARFSRSELRALFWMGALGFTLAMALSHWGLALSTATNGAILIAVEPLAMIALAPVLLGERLTRREGWGTAMALLGATLVVVNGIPGVTSELVPRWRGDLLLLLSGVCFAAYSLFGRPLLVRHPSLPVTTWSLVWGLGTMAPLAALEWARRPPAWTPVSVTMVLYLGVVITALGFLVWNWALERVSAPRAAIFLNIQPLVGALLGILWLGETATVFTAAGGGLVLGGLAVALSRPGRGR